MAYEIIEDALVVEITARIAEFEKALEEQFKPALRTAIAEVMDEFFSHPVPGVTMKMEVAE